MPTESARQISSIRIAPSTAYSANTKTGLFCPGDWKTTYPASRSIAELTNCGAQFLITALPLLNENEESLLLQCPLEEERPWRACASPCAMLSFTGWIALSSWYLTPRSLTKMPKQSETYWRYHGMR